jgi:hypothetical protein
MAPRKLSESDKQDILNLYRDVMEESTTTLASRYDVSTSTISRLLKQNLPEAEYEALIQQKRGSRSQAEPEGSLTIPGISGLIAPELFMEPEPIFVPISEPVLEPLPEPVIKSRAPIIRKNRKPEEFSPEPEAAIEFAEAAESPRFEKPVSKAALLGNEEFADLDDDLDDDLEDDEDDLGDDDFDEESEDGLGSFGAIQVNSKGMVQIQPLVETAIPKTCYVVVDRSSELITRPLKDFAELGQIPSEEDQEKTLPIFDNHRIAKRFMRRMQRVVKVPDGRVFSKVRPYLQAKGITRLLIDGQVYSL